MFCVFLTSVDCVTYRPLNWNDGHDNNTPQRSALAQCLHSGFDWS